MTRFGAAAAGALRGRRARAIMLVAASAAAAVACGDRGNASVAEWTAYGHDAGGSRYSPAAEITRDNVAQLRPAWVYRTGDFAVGEGAARFESTPLVVDGTLYVSTPFGRVIALDPERGTER